jgi:hypothetical protein
VAQRKRGRWEKTQPARVSHKSKIDQIFDLAERAGRTQSHSVENRSGFHERVKLNSYSFNPHETQAQSAPDMVAFQPLPENPCISAARHQFPTTIATTGEN